MTALMGAIRTRILLALLAVLASIGLLEATVRACGLAPGFLFKGLLVRLDADVLYRTEPGGHFQLNAHGFRDRDFQPRSPDTKRVLMLGDSFLMGLGVKSRETLPASLERVLGRGYEVLNMGVIGDGPDQSWLRLRQTGFALEPDTVLLTVFPANDFEDLRKNGLVSLAENGEIQLTSSNPVKRWLRPLQIWPLIAQAISGEFLPADQQQKLIQTLFNDTYDFSLLTSPMTNRSVNKKRLMRGVLQALQSELELRGVQFGVIVIPSYQNIQNDRLFRERGIPRQDYFRLEEYVVASCKELEIPHVDLTHAFRSQRRFPIYLESDLHLSPFGGRVAAEAAAILVDRR